MVCVEAGLKQDFQDHCHIFISTNLCLTAALFLAVYRDDTRNHFDHSQTAPLLEMQPSPELRKQTSAVYNQAPSSSGEEVINNLPTWNCRRNPEGCMQGPIWALGRKLRWILLVQKIGLSACMATAPRHRFHVFFLNLSLWQNNSHDLSLCYWHRQTITSQITPIFTYP